jgi:hypothetical protein
MTMHMILALSLPGRHARQPSSAALFVGSYIGFWTVICPPVTMIATMLQMILPAPWPLVLVCIAAIVWQMSLAKHDRLRPKTPDASLASLGDGIRYGMRCVISCWVLMLLPLPRRARMSARWRS